MSIAVVIPSKTDNNLWHCMGAVMKHELTEFTPEGYARAARRPDFQVIVVDDGLEKRGWSFAHHYKLTYIDGIKPFVYARNCNLGIREALKDERCEGVVLLNDDALLESPGGFSLMAQACREHPEYGLIGATTKVVGNPNQFPKGVGLRDEPRMVCFLCVYIPRTTFDRVGLLDERYVGYGLDDDDFSFEVRAAGLKIGVHDGCYVDHGSLRSTFRGDPKTPADFRPNLERFKEKWGVDNWGRPV